MRERIVEFVQHRSEMIRNGDRAGLDATYDGLDRRNEYNCHDYDWYLDMIEQGFGGVIRRIDIVPIPDTSMLRCARRCAVIFPSLPEALTTSVEKTGAVFGNPQPASVFTTALCRQLDEAAAPREW